jgi:quercetin dioxygenase-like cupin family protein
VIRPAFAISIAAFATAAIMAEPATPTRLWREGGPQPPPGITREAILDNATALIAHLTMAPGSRETVHTHPFSAVVIQTTPGTIDMTLGAERSARAHDPGFFWFVPKDTPHAAVSVETRDIEFVTIGIKPDRPPAAAAPPTASPAGITRETLLDNAEARVVRVTFAPGGREPTHTHPNDLVTVQLTPGRVEIVEGSARSDEMRKAGFVKFLGRGVPHSYASSDAKPFEILSVAIK